MAKILQPEIKYTDGQIAAMTCCNEVLEKQGLPTYTQLEDQLAMAFMATLEGINLGKRLVAKIKQMELQLKRANESNKQ